MTIPRFRKRLSANDVGTTGGHQGGILVPRGEKELLAILAKNDGLQTIRKADDAWSKMIAAHDRLITSLGQLPSEPQVLSGFMWSRPCESSSHSL